LERTLYQHRKENVEVWARNNRQQSISSTTYRLDGTSKIRGHYQRDDHLYNYLLVDLAAGVAYPPSGQDRGILNAAVEFALQHGHDNVSLSGFDAYFRKYRSELEQGLASMRHGINEDIDARKRHRKAISGYHNSIQSAKVSGNGQK
jgi:hypothetical protein